MDTSHADKDQAPQLRHERGGSDSTMTLAASSNSIARSRRSEAARVKVKFGRTSGAKSDLKLVFRNPPASFGYACRHSSAVLKAPSLGQTGSFVNPCRSELGSLHVFILSIVVSSSGGSFVPGTSRSRSLSGALRWLCTLGLYQQWKIVGWKSIIVRTSV